MTAPRGSGPVVAILGAESTGKSELARALSGALHERGLPCSLVEEHLRDWCIREGRTPRIDEQAAIAGEQSRRIALAAAQGWVVADTTALMTAIYSDLLFDDGSLYEPALLELRETARFTLVTALDLPWVADGLQRDGPHVREPVDALLRAALQRGGIGYSVVHGSGAQRLANALRAIGLADARPGADRPLRPCETCSDPDCEHRLFTDLLNSP